MIPAILFTLFLSSVAGVETVGEKLDLAVLLRRISYLEEEKLDQAMLLRRISDLEEKLDQSVLLRRISDLEEEKLDQAMLLRRISDLEERLDVQERLNEEQDALIKTLLLEKTERTGVSKTEILTSIFETDKNGDGLWQNGDLENKTILGEDARVVTNGISSHILPTLQNAVKDSKNISPELNTKKVQRTIASGDVAFYSYLSHHENYPGHHQTIIFDHVFTNVGGNYNHHSGIFTSPQNGVYAFLWTLYCNTGGHISTELVVNSNPVGGAHCNAQGADNIRHATGVVIVQINVGDIVFVRTHPTYSMAGLIYSNLHAPTSFSGWKVF